MLPPLVHGELSEKVAVHCCASALPPRLSQAASKATCIYALDIARKTGMKAVAAACSGREGKLLNGTGKTCLNKKFRDVLHMAITGAPALLYIATRQSHLTASKALCACWCAGEQSKQQLLQELHVIEDKQQIKAWWCWASVEDVFGISCG